MSFLRVTFITGVIFILTTLIIFSSEKGVGGRYEFDSLLTHASGPRPVTVATHTLCNDFDWASGADPDDVAGYQNYAGVNVDGARALQLYFEFGDITSGLRIGHLFSPVVNDTSCVGYRNDAWVDTVGYDATADTSICRVTVEIKPEGEYFVGFYHLYLRPWGTKGNSPIWNLNASLRVVY